jgi:hypothetical protein
VRLWDPRVSSSSTAARVFDLPQAHTDVVRALAMYDDSQALLSGGSDGALVAWDLRVRRAVYVYTPLLDADAAAERATAAQNSSGGSSDSAGGPPLRRARTEDDFEAPTSDAGSIVALCVSADGRRVVCGVQRPAERAAPHGTQSQQQQRARGAVCCTDLETRRSALAAADESLITRVA